MCPSNLMWCKAARCVRIGRRTVAASFSTDLEDLLEIPGVGRKIDEIKARHHSLSNQVTDRTSSADSAEIHRELASCELILSTSKEMSRIREEITDLRSLIENRTEEQEMKECAIEELAATKDKMNALSEQLLLGIVPPETEDPQDVIVEVRSGVGGTEGSLFALDLFRMYQKYAQLKKWKSEVMEMSSVEAGGIKFASLSISGKGAFGRMKMENGVHRVQRVPQTEKAGRLQTSAASVVVMLHPSEVDVVLDPDDLRIDVYRSSGAGGQHVNTTESAVRITHKPTRISVAIQDERSQHKNKDKAMRILRAKLYELKRTEQAKDISESRMQSIGSGDRSARIRTYNYPQDRVTDHRIQHTEFGVDQMMEGVKLDSFAKKLTQHYRLQRLKETITSSVRS